MIKGASASLYEVNSSNNSFSFGVGIAKTSYIALFCSNDSKIDLVNLAGLSNSPTLCPTLLILSEYAGPIPYPVVPIAFAPFNFSLA